MTAATTQAGEVFLLENRAMRARRRPGAVLLVAGWQAACALAVAWPAATVISALWGQHPDGDGGLLQPGGFSALHFVQDNPALLAGGSKLFAAVVALGTVTGLLPLGALLASMACSTRDREAPPIGAMLARGARAMPAFVALFAATSAIEGAVLLFARTAGFALTHRLSAAHSKSFADVSGIALGVAVACALPFVIVLQDLARAAIVRYQVSALRGARLAIATIASAPFGLVASWAWRALARLVPIAVGAAVAVRVGARGGGPLIALGIVHQMVIVACAALRASWLARALRAVDARGFDAPR